MIISLLYYTPETYSLYHSKKAKTSIYTWIAGSLCVGFSTFCQRPYLPTLVCLCPGYLSFSLSVHDRSRSWGPPAPDLMASPLIGRRPPEIVVSWPFYEAGGEVYGASDLADGRSMDSWIAPVTIVSVGQETTNRVLDTKSY